MKITYIAQYFRTPAVAGGSRCYEFARRFAAAGHEVHVITGEPYPGEAAPRHGTTVEAGVVVHWLPVPYRNEMRYSRRILAFFQFVAMAATAAARLPTDVVLATSTPLTVALPGAFAARRRGVPMVLEVRDLWPEVPIALGALRSRPARWAARWLEGWAYRRSAHVVALSPGMAEGVRRRDPRVPVTVVPNSADLALFADADRAGRALRAATPWLGDRPLILYAGSFGLVNNLDYLVRMAADLVRTDPQVRIALIGGGRMRDDVADLARRLGVLGRNLFLLGEVSKREVIAYFGACDLAVSTTLNVPALGANSANKVFDAFAAGRPVGVNHGGWLADLLTETGAGLVLPPDDPAGAAAAAAAFLRDADACAAARAAAARLGCERFDRDLLFRDLERVLGEAVGAGRGAGVPAAPAPA